MKLMNTFCNIYIRYRRIKIIIKQFTHIRCLGETMRMQKVGCLLFGFWLVFGMFVIIIIYYKRRKAK